MKIDVEVLAQVRKALAGLEAYDLTVPPDRRVHAALAALRAAETRLANPLVNVNPAAGAAAVEGLREAAGLSPRRDDPLAGPPPRSVPPSGSR